MDTAERVRREQARAQARDDARAIEMKKVRAFLRMALPDNAVLPEAKKIKPKQHSFPGMGKPDKPKNTFRTESSAVITGDRFSSSVCRCAPWDECTCAAHAESLVNNI